jgi:hypothetical protein
MIILKLKIWEKNPLIWKPSYNATIDIKNVLSHEMI